MSALGNGLLAGLQAGLQYKVSDMQHDKDKQEKLADQQAHDAAEMQAWQAKQAWLADNEPPKTQKQTMTDPNDPNKVIDANQEWQRPSNPALGPPTAGQWKTTSSAPSINFGRLEETRRNNDMKNENAQERLRLQGEANAAKAEAAALRGGGGSGKSVSYADYAAMSPDEKETYDRFRRGAKVSPDEAASAREDRDAKIANAKADLLARRETSKQLTESGDVTPAQKSTMLYDNQVQFGADPFASVIPGAKTSAPLSQFKAGNQSPAQGPTQGSNAPPEGTIVVRNGVRYVVKNGQPVPL